MEGGTVSAALDAMGDPTRRAIVSMLAEAPAPCRRSPTGYRSADQRCPGTFGY